MHHGTTRYLPLIALCFVLTGCARHSDRDWVHHEFGVPQDVELSVNSTPDGESNWADRKDLILNATFKFTPTQLLQYTRSIEGDTVDWHPLPLPADLQKSLQKRLNPIQIKTLTKATHGFYYFKTANGQNLLKSSIRSDWNPTIQLQDIELGMLDSDSAELKITVRQFY
jgi:hypothetical protein